VLTCKAQDMVMWGGNDGSVRRWLVYYSGSGSIGFMGSGGKALHD
jgi:hypothetical protein